MIKSKIIAFAATIALVGAMAVSASAFVFNTNMGFGMRSSDVSQLQLRLNAETGSTLPGTTYYGSLTRAAVISYQTMKGITPAVGYTGPLTRAALNGSVAPSGTLPAGCTSTTGWSPTTGVACNTTVGSTLPLGCTSTTGWSPSTGVKCDTGGTTPPQTGPVTAMLSYDNPVTGVVVSTQAGADLAHFTFTGTGTVTSVTLKRTGISADSSLSDVYLYDGQTRLTDSSSVTSGSMITFNDPAGLFTVAGSRTISVRADLAATAGETVGVQLIGYTSGTATTLSTPISGNLMSVATATLAAVSFGSITPTTNASLNPGLDVLTWQSTATITTRDVWLTRMAIKVVGSVSSADLKNFRLIIGSTTVATVDSMDSNGYVTFVPTTPYKMITGSSSIKVMADVIGGASKNFTMKFQSKTDIGLVDSQYNAAFLTSTALSNLSGNQQTIIGGTMTVQKDTTSPSSTIVANGTDQVFARYKITTYGEAVKADNVVVDFTSSVTATLRNGRVLIDGQQVGSTATLSPASTGTTYNINYTFQPGTSILEVRADVFDNDGTGTLANGDTFLVSLYGNASLNNAIGKVSGNTIDFPGSAPISANTLTVGVGTLVLAKDQTYSNSTAVLPATARLLGQYTLTSGSNEGINIDTFLLTLAGGTPASDVTNVYVTYGAKTTSVKPVGAASQTWSVSETVAASSTMTFKVYADLGTSLSTNTIIPTLTISGTSNSGTAVSTDAVAGQSTTGATSGVLTVSLDTNSPQSAQVVAGSTDTNGLLKLKLAGTNEDMYVKKVTTYIKQTAYTTGVVSSVDMQMATISNGTYTTVGTSQTVNNDGTLPGYVTWNLSGSGRITVPANGSVYLKFVPTYVPSGPSITVSGELPTMFLADLQAEGTSALVAGGAGTLINTTGIIVQANSSATYATSTETLATAIASATIATVDMTGTTAFVAGDVFFIDTYAADCTTKTPDSLWSGTCEELFVVLANDGAGNLTVKRGAFGTTANAVYDSGDTLYSLGGLVANTNNVIGNAMTVLKTKLSLAVKSDSPSGATSSGTGKYVFGFTATAANNSADSATNTATLTYVDVTATESGTTTLSNLKLYPSEYDNNATYATTCGALTASKWRCTLSSTGSTNQIDENTSRSYMLRGDTAYAANGSIDISIAALGTSSTSTNSVYWTDGTTAQYWVNQSASFLQSASPLSSSVASGTADATAPTISSIVMSNGAVLNDIDNLDYVTITYSEVIDPTTINATLVPGGSVTGVASGNGLMTVAQATSIVTVAGMTTFDSGASVAVAVSAPTQTIALDTTGKIVTITWTAMTGGGTITTPAGGAGTQIAGVYDVNGNNSGTPATPAASGAF